METYIYLHGFASSPRSAKAHFFRDRFQSIQHSLIIPDLNQDDFTTLTLTRQIQQVTALLPPEHESVTLIGSSFGGLTAAWVGDRCPQVKQLVLLAPAFDFLTHWQPKLGIEQMQRWQQEQYLAVYHYGENQMRPLGYQFITDMAQYPEKSLQRPIPTLILHGRQDDVIPITASQNFAADRPWVQLIELESDHALTNVQPELWRAIAELCHL